MARPVKCRKVCCGADSRCFHPIGKDPRRLLKVEMTLDELEAVKLLDYEGKYQEEAAKSMGVSRQTIGNIVESARHKMAEAILYGKLLSVRGGNIVKKKAKSGKKVA
jgi:predicted DNA-binding protein (UPF0251 family)